MQWVLLLVSKSKLFYDSWVKGYFLCMHAILDIEEKFSLRPKKKKKKLAGQ